MGLGLPAGLAAAADIAVNAVINQVTVYRQGATVARAAEVTVPAGTHRLIFSGLPAGIDAKTLRVTLGTAGVTLGAIEVARINEGAFVSEPERELRRRIEDLGDQRALLQDEIATAQNQLKLLDSLASNPEGSPNKAVVDAATLGTMLAAMAAGGTGARKRVRDAGLQLRTLDRQLEQLKADLGKVATASKQSTEVRAAVEAATPLTAAAVISYRIANAGWEWIYEARLDTAKKRLVLERQGSVTQGSGEDWKNVDMTLTTAVPASDLNTPDLKPLFVDLRRPDDAFGMSGKATTAGVATTAAFAPAESTARLQEVTVTGARRQAAQAASTEYVADYRVPSRVSVLADRQPRLYPIGENAFDVGLVARVVPSLSSGAHLEAVFKYTDPLPIEAGELELYRDGAYVGEADTESFLPGADVRMPFGVDERVRVAIREEGTQSGQKGILSRQEVKETRRRIEITNFHPTAIAVEVLDHIPVSKNADVHVEMLKGGTDPTLKDLDGKAGVWLWKLEPAPQQTMTIHQAFAIEYPAGRQLQESVER